jgi:crotonobetainyl-CoA:carnitine CoA-transferase CaiB-like acyl-CoA transferase
MAPVLDGIRVVELTEALAGPYCAMLLGDMGAGVVKVERPPIGDQSRTWGPPFIGTESAYFLATNRNKRSIALDYNDASGMEILQRLLATADVFLCNQPSMESLQRRGLDPITLRARFPRLIYCSITGYGLTGPKSGKPGYDILAQAEAGVMSFTGEPGGEPMRFPVAIADITTGIYSAVGILGALYAREKTGQGDFLDMALFDSQLTWLANVGSNYLNTGVEPQRWGNAHANIVPYQPFRGSDGHFFVVGVGTQPAWQRLLKLLKAEEQVGNDPRFASNPLRVQNREVLIPLLQAQFSGLTSKEWLTKLAEADIPGARVQTVGEALNDPQSMARGLVVEIEHPSLHAVRTIANPVRYQQQTIVYKLPPPLLGEHTNEIRKELGCPEF